MVKKTAKTLYTNNKNVDISSLIIQSGGAKKNAKDTKDAKKKKDSDDEYSDNSLGGDSDQSDISDSENSDMEQDDGDGKDDNANKDDDNDEMGDNDDIDKNSEKDDDDKDDDKDSDNSSDENSNADEKEEKDYIEDEETLNSKCYSKYAKVDYDELDFDELFGEENLIINKNARLTKPILTKYEFVRLLTDRSKQLAQGAKSMLKNVSGLSSKEIAKLELKNKIIPLIIERPIPNSIPERWKLSELEIPEYLFTN